MVEKASHTGMESWHTMWRANEAASRRNLKEGRLIANAQGKGWGAADVRINFNEVQSLPPVSPQVISMVVLSQGALPVVNWLLERYNQMRLVGEILLVNQCQAAAVEKTGDWDSKVTVINAIGEVRPFPRLAVAVQAAFPAVLLTSDDIFLPEETLTHLHKAWFADPWPLHGITGRNLIEDVSSARSAFGPCDVVLSEGALTTIDRCVRALAYGARLATDIKRLPKRNCEDILLSFVAAKASDRLNRAYRLPFSRLRISGSPLRDRTDERLDFPSRVVSWCRRNVSASADLAIEVAPSPPSVINYQPPSTPLSKAAVLFAGPWVGEFGWELCWWNPMIRCLAEDYEHIIVAAPEASRYLYEFADEFIPLKTEGWRFAEGALLSESPRVCNGSKTLSPSTLWAEFGLREYEALKSGGPVPTPKKWRLLAPQFQGPFVADILCAFRQKKIIGKYRIEEKGKEYSPEKSAELISLLLDAGLRVACYGGKDNYWFEGTIDLRGKPLEAQCSALSSAKCAVGPSSGTIHLASLCNCPHVTWYRNDGHLISPRYEINWNPFSTPVRFLQTPDPSPVEIAEETLSFVETLYDVREGIPQEV